MAPQTEVVDRLDPATVAALSRLDDRVADETGVAPLDEAAWLQIGAGGAAVSVHALARGADQEVEGYAHLAPGDQRWTLRLLVPPDRADLAVPLVEALAATAPGEPVGWFVPGAGPPQEEMAVNLALEPGRELWQMRRPLPVDESWSLDWRPFRPGRDESAWMEVNNRAFAGHPDQANRTIDDIRTLELEPWFDPAGFLLCEEDGRLLGFCWTKVHHDTDPPLGEIYVIGVDPSAHGRGLGRNLVLAGLDWLHRAGLRTGMLYVDADNDAAVALYEKLGFATVQRDVFFTGLLPG